LASAAHRFGGHFFAGLTDVSPLGGIVQLGWKAELTQVIDDHRLSIG
jgi:hypothetical protein